MCLFVSKKILKNALSQVAKAFKDVLLNNNNKKQIHIRMLVYLMQVRAVLFAPPLSKSHMVVTVSNSNS